MDSCMRFIFIILIFTTVNKVSADTLWKLGAGIGNITAHSYIGSDQAQTITSPIPYLKVKTEWFDLDNEGLHTNWFEETRFRLDFSFDLGLPVDSNEIKSRNGMPDLDPVGQLGPLLIYQLYDSRILKWQLHLPLTYAYAVDGFEVNSVGWASNPRIYFNYLYGDLIYPLDISMSFGSVYASEEFHRYYYDVEPGYITAERNVYSATEGAAGYRFIFSMTRRMNGYWLGLYVRYQNLSDAVFADSPLVDQQDYWFIALGASWLFAGDL